MDDLKFLEAGGDADAAGTLRITLPDGQVRRISDRICPDKLLELCPILCHTFEHGSENRSQACIPAPSVSAAIALLRFCYTDNYLPPGFDAAALPLLPHAEVYKLAKDFAASELQQLAHANFTYHTEMACSFPEFPCDLLETIRFVYLDRISQKCSPQQGLLETLLNYCIAVFERQKLATSPQFLALLEAIPEFHQDLCRTLRLRNFEDDCAFEIMRLALDTPEAESSVRSTSPDDLASSVPEEEFSEETPSAPESPDSFTLVFRPEDTEFISDEDEWTLI